MLVAAFASAVLLLASARLAVAWEDPLQVSDEEARAAIISKSEPVYPPIAKQMRVTGKVTVEAMIDAQGKVEECRPSSGNPLLTPAAVAAVKKWMFKPFNSGGKPTRALAKLTLTFSL